MLLHEKGKESEKKMGSMIQKESGEYGHAFSSMTFKRDENIKKKTAKG